MTARVIRTIALATVGLLALADPALAAATADEAAGLTRVQQTLVTPPALPAHSQVAETGPVVVEVRLVVEEKLINVTDDGAKVWAMTFNGSVPGPMIVVHEGDFVELTLVNPTTSTMGHNVDMHAATGGQGGGTLTVVPPGQQTVVRYKATKPGVFVYNCAPGGVLTTLHVVSGMNGAIMVLPRDGLKDAQGRRVRYDRAFYIGEQDYYLPRDDAGNFKTYAKPVDGFGEMLDVMRTLTPTHIVFNGSANALTGEHRLHASVGEKVLFIHSQANRDSRVRLSGGHGDLVWAGGSFSNRPMTDLEVWPVPAGSAVAALYEFKQPGTYLYENHNLIEANVLGASARVDVEGEWDDNLMRQVQKPAPVTPVSD